MQDEGSAKKGLNPALEKHWDKLVLAAVGVAFLVFLGSQFSSGKTAAAKRVDDVARVVETKKGNSAPGIDAPKPPAEIKLAAPAMALKPNDWAVGVQTNIVPEIRQTAGPVAVGFFLPKLTLGAPQASVDGVELRWTLTGEPDKDERPARIKVPPATFFFLVERRKKGDAGWTVLEKELKGSSRYIDQKTTPKTEYEYKVTLGSTDPAWVAKNPARLSKEIAGPFATMTPGIWEFHFSNVTAPNDEGDVPIPGTVYVKIVKYDPEFGKVEWNKIHKDKTPLGIADGTSKHAVFSSKKGKTVEVDFNSGAKLVSIEADKLIPYEYKVCEMKPGPGGLVCAGTETKKDKYRANVIKFIDEEGKPQETQWATSTARMQDNLCPDHGGAPPPKALSPEEVAAEKEKEIEKLLDEADRLWASDKPSDQRKAQEKYLKIIKAHENSPAVKARRTEINDRVKKKIE